MFILVDLIRFEIRNDSQAVSNFLQHMMDTPLLMEANQPGGHCGLGNYIGYFKPEARDELHRYITNQIK